MTRCTKQVLRKGWMTCQSILPCFAWRRGMSYMGVHQHIFEKSSMFNSFLSLQNLFSSMCFVLECWTGLLVSFTTLSLSHSNVTCLNLIPKSLKVAFIQSNWAQQLPAKMYSASAVESATLFCFSLMTKTQVIFPIVDMCPMCSFSQLCIPHNRSPNIQST